MLLKTIRIVQQGTYLSSYCFLSGHILLHFCLESVFKAVNNTFSEYFNFILFHICSCLSVACVEWSGEWDGMEGWMGCRGGEKVSTAESEK